jgi:hypothetical protein
MPLALLPFLLGILLGRKLLSRPMIFPKKKLYLLLSREKLLIPFRLNNIVLMLL